MYIIVISSHQRKGFFLVHVTRNILRNAISFIAVDIVELFTDTFALEYCEIISGNLKNLVM